MDIDIRGLRCFVSVAEEASFTRAAARLNLTQPAVSAQVRGLEARLGLALFTRTTRRTELTPAGRELLTAARGLVDENDRLARRIAELRGGDAGRLRLGAAIYTIDIPERIALIERFMAAHREVALDVDNRNQADLLPDLERGVVDLALIIGMPVPTALHARLAARGEAGEILYSEELRRVVLRRERVALLVPRESVLARHEMIPLNALAGERVAMIAREHGAPLVDPLQAHLRAAGATLIVPPEGNGIGVERYGRQFRIAAVSLGWFGLATTRADDMLRRPVEGLILETELAIVAAPGAARPAAAKFLRLVQTMAG
jgi:DNA-binding transcriptional LysR family regulator